MKLRSLRGFHLICGRRRSRRKAPPAMPPAADGYVEYRQARMDAAHVPTTVRAWVSDPIPDAHHGSSGVHIQDCHNVTVRDVILMHTKGMRHAAQASAELCAAAFVPREGDTVAIHCTNGAAGMVDISAVGVTRVGNVSVDIGAGVPRA